MEVSLRTLPAMYNNSTVDCVDPQQVMLLCLPNAGGGTCAPPTLDPVLLQLLRSPNFLVFGMSLACPVAGANLKTGGRCCRSRWDPATGILLPY